MWACSPLWPAAARAQRPPRRLTLAQRLARPCSPRRLGPFLEVGAGLGAAGDAAAVHARRHLRAAGRAEGAEQRRVDPPDPHRGLVAGTPGPFGDTPDRVA